MILLGIESSCDETAAAIVNDKKEILGECVLTQLEHKAFGGVVPEIAARSHLEHIEEIIEETFKRANIKPTDIDAVAAASGPGLIGGVVVGVMAAKALSLALNKPFIAVNHLEGHALAARLTSDVEYPYLLLLVSGGHCQILIVKGVGEFERLGTTIDDAAGEAFDKVAKYILKSLFVSLIIGENKEHCWTDFQRFRSKFRSLFSSLYKVCDCRNAASRTSPPLTRGLWQSCVGVSDN